MTALFASPLVHTVLKQPLGITAGLSLCSSKTRDGVYCFPLATQ
jgi:hypothetical protein